MNRLIIPALCVLILLGTAVGLAILPLKAEEASCHATALQVATGKELAGEHEEECHEKATTAITVAGATAGVGLVAVVATGLILAGRGEGATTRREEGAAEPAGAS